MLFENLRSANVLLELLDCRGLICRDRCSNPVQSILCVTELSMCAECRNEQRGAAEGISRPSPSPCFDWQVDCGRRKDATMDRSSLVSVALSSQHGAPAPSAELQSGSVVSTECGRGGVSCCI